MTLPNSGELQQRLQDYRQFDEARQADVEVLAATCHKLSSDLLAVQSDLDHERNTRRTWKKRAEEAEASIRRKFVVVLVDGDGYIFRKAFFKAVAVSGGSKAANDLHTEVLNNLRDPQRSTGISPDCDVLVNIYACKAGLAKALAAANFLARPADIDQFFCSFSQSRSLFQFIDCGRGKERADAKLRGMPAACPCSDADPDSYAQMPLDSMFSMLNANVSFWLVVTTMVTSPSLINTVMIKLCRQRLCWCMPHRPVQPHKPMPASHSSALDSTLSSRLRH